MKVAYAPVKFVFSSSRGAMIMIVVPVQNGSGLWLAVWIRVMIYAFLHLPRD